ncbi:hypothetical protein MNBD_GAMMA21-1424 [hydrothermal vent metagenome]|uniref:Nitroreductase domain-containing protein n=1 Tax=hydrothermal vent metagenome TaxID=652676 RepID=A0A3B1A543_9ZZZZ
MFHKPAKTDINLHAIIADRWSGVAFDSERWVERDNLNTILEAARWCASCYGDQPWRYIVTDRNTRPDDWNSAFECLLPANQKWAIHAPVLILACCKNVFQNTGEPNLWAKYDTGAASISMVYQATALGLMVCQIGGFDSNRARTSFAIPNEFTPLTYIAVGYQLPEEKIPDELMSREYAIRQRMPLQKIVFEGRWDRAFNQQDDAWDLDLISAE